MRGFGVSGQVIPIYIGINVFWRRSQGRYGPGEFIQAWLDLVLIQGVWAAGSGADSAVGRIDGDHGGAAALYVDIVGGSGQIFTACVRGGDHAWFI